MNDFIDVGSAPTSEPCAQVGRPDYYDRARRECRAYIAQLRRHLGHEPDGANLSVRSNDHDFGKYLSVACYYDPAQPESLDYALRCESQGPSEWDEQARKELSV